MTAEGVIDPGRAVDPLVLALDVGTSSARGVVYDGKARAVQGWEAHHPYFPTTTPDGGAYLQPRDLLNAVISAIDKTENTVRTAGRTIAAVGCDTFWHGLMGIDRSGRPTTDVLTWADTRSHSAVAELRKCLDEREIHRRTGAVFHSSYWPAKLRWLARSDTNAFRDTVRWVSPAEYLYGRLLGDCRCSISMASGTGLYDQHRCDWDDALLQAVGVERDQLAPVDDFDKPAQGLTTEFASRWPLLASVPWYLPVGDGACSNLGSGGTTDRRMVLMIGTSGALRVVRKARTFDIAPGVWTYRVDRRRIVVGGALSNGGNAFAWLTRELQLPPVADIEKRLLDLPPDGHGLTVLPFFAGERSPDWDATARAVFSGLTLNTTSLQIAQATLEAIAFRFARVYSILCRHIPGVQAIIGSGVGLIRSPAWQQILADALGQPIALSCIPEATARGAALLALEALGAIPQLEALPPEIGTMIYPRSDATNVYRAAAARQDALYRQIGQTFEEQGTNAKT